MVLCLLPVSVSSENKSYVGCDKKRDVLLRALFETEDNLNQLDSVFYPQRHIPTRFLTVNYQFLDINGSKDNCMVSYFWAVGGFLFIQPPTIFWFASLLSNYDVNELRGLNLTLPHECRGLVNITDEGNCSCGSSSLDRLTQQVPLP